MPSRAVQASINQAKVIELIRDLSTVPKRLGLTQRGLSQSTRIVITTDFE